MERMRIRLKISGFCEAAACIAVLAPCAAQSRLLFDPPAHTITVSDRAGTVKLRIDTATGCSVDRLEIRGEDVERADTAMCSGIRVGGRWYTTRALPHAPTVAIRGESVEIGGIEYDGGGVQVRERWTFTPTRNSVRWRIDRTYLSSGLLEDTAMPMATFRDMSTWTGALLGTGGVAWGKLFDAPDAAYAIHTGSATFWNRERKSCFRFATLGGDDGRALRFTREPDGGFTMAAEAARGELVPRYAKARFRRDNPLIWADFPVTAGQTISAEYELAGPDFDATFGRGDFRGLDTAAITELLNTIGRIGVVDRNLVGSNGWYSGFVCLHEPWLAAVNIALNDPNYLRSYAATLDNERDHAIMPDGMVKSRWSYYSGDATHGTYDANGFYEAQWGRLMDTQTSYVNDVADQFDLSGDVKWVRGQKQACEAALDYLLKRDKDGNGLVEMANDSLKQRRSSDWLDIVWASYENALVNAQLYRSLLGLARIERILGDGVHAARYTQCAERLKVSFNKTVAEGGFWNPEKGWYIYWRERDGSAHGDNLTLPVNLTALAEGLCDDPARRKRLLGTIEDRMKAESLLSWPSCFYPFAAGEGANAGWPEYENGDIFLAWAEYGMRAYASDRPEIAVKYLRRIVDRYKQDGLAFQRYLRADGKGAGDDILSNNCNAVVGLYRDIYGIQPKFNRLQLAPHLTPDLNGTRVRYDLRGRQLEIDLSVRRYRVRTGRASVSSSSAFGVDLGSRRVACFAGHEEQPAFSVDFGEVGGVAIELRSGNGRTSAVISGFKKPGRIAVTMHGLPKGVRLGIGRQTVDAAHPTARVRVVPGKSIEILPATKHPGDASAPADGWN